MKFRTEFDIPVSQFKINSKSKVLTIGSCFSDVLGNYLINNKISCLNNPFGNIYNLEAISKIISIILEKKDIDPKKIIEVDEIFFHYDYHSTIKAYSAKELIENISKINLEIFSFLKDCDFLVITLGTSWVYYHKNLEAFVSNCHKQSNYVFDKILISLSHQIEIFKSLLENLRIFNPNLKILLTVSPVRHLKDGIPQNQVSKSILRVLCNEICCNNKNIAYFPSYELMMDDLRDYRFYKEDLIHPTEMAEKYILKAFENTYFDQDLIESLKVFDKIKNSLNHKPFNPNSKAHQQFLNKTKDKLLMLKQKIDVSEEINQIDNLIIS
jgi:hypothetical protein